RQLERRLRWRHRGQVDDPPLGLRDDLLGDHQDVAGLEALPLGREGIDQYGGHVVARPDLADAADRDDPDLVAHAGSIVPAISWGTSWMWWLTARSTASGSPLRIASTIG